MPLTEADIQQARPGHKLYMLDDTDGLYLIVTPKGEKVWRFRFLFDREERVLFLGPYPEIGLAEARAERDLARAYLRDHKDPWLEMRRRKNEARTPSGNSDGDVVRDEAAPSDAAAGDDKVDLRARGAVPRIVLGPKIFAVGGRHVTLFGPSMLQRRERGAGYEFMLFSQNERRQPLAQGFTTVVDIAADRLGEMALLKLLSRAAEPFEISFPLTIVKSAAAKVASPACLMIGDSVTAGTQQAVGDMMASTAVTPTWIGTRRWNGTTIDGEGRAGWRVADFVHEDTRYAPLAPGEESAARTSNTDERNPFLRVATDADDPAMVRNGQIFDFRFYLDRFGFPDPASVTIELGINDIRRDGLVTGMERAVAGIALIVSAIKAAVPACRIGLAAPMIGNHPTYNHYWELGLAPLVLDHLARYADDPRVDVVNTHAAMADRLIFPTKPRETDTVTGQTVDWPTDRTHATATPIGCALYAEQIFAFHHACATGGGEEPAAA